MYFLHSTGYTLPPLTTATFCYSMATPTVAIMLAQTVPNTVPWCVLTVELNCTVCLSFTVLHSCSALHCTAHLTLFFSPPVTLMSLLPSISPPSLHRGVLSAHLHDFLATDEKLSMHQATSYIAVFGAGAASGGLLGMQAPFTWPVTHSRIHYFFISWLSACLTTHTLIITKWQTD